MCDPNVLQNYMTFLLGGPFGNWDVDNSKFGMPPKDAGYIHLPHEKPRQWLVSLYRLEKWTLTGDRYYIYVKTYEEEDQDENLEG